VDKSYPPSIIITTSQGWVFSAMVKYSIREILT
jgi:hypothetical protein